MFPSEPYGSFATGVILETKVMNLSGSIRLTLNGKETSSGSYVSSRRHRRADQASGGFKFPKGQRGAAKPLMDVLEASEKLAVQGEAGKQARELVASSVA